MPGNSVFHHEILILRAINTQVPTSVVEREFLRHLMWGEVLKIILEGLLHFPSVCVWVLSVYSYVHMCSGA